MKTCTSCNTIIGKEFAEFKCPQCEKHKIIRCGNCKTTSRPYTCPDCEFEGP